MIQKKNNLFELIEGMMGNEIDDLEELHKRFKPIILKYSALLELSVAEIQSEFDFILINIYKAKITDELKILNYIKTAFKNLRKQKYLKINKEESFCVLNSNLIFFDTISNLNDEMKEIFKLRFLYSYRLSEIGALYGVSRQCIDKKIKNEFKNIRI